MTTIPLIITLAAPALLRTGGPAVMPRTDRQIPGTTLRGVFAALASLGDGTGNGSALTDWVVSRRLKVSPGFPALESGLPAHPAPRTVVQQALDGELRMRHIRDLSGFDDYKQVRSMIRLTEDEVVPVVLHTQTSTRLARDRVRGAVAGFGPFTAELLSAHQRFVVVLEWDGTYDELATPLARALEAGGGEVRIGSGAHTAFGGSASIEIGAELPRGPLSLINGVAGPVEAGCLLEAMLWSPALVRGEDGSHEPKAVAGHLASLLASAWSVDHVEVAVEAVASTFVGGAHRGYGNSRPAHAAAAAGTVLRVTAPKDLTDDNLVSACRRRLGERAVDGWGVWSFMPSLEGVARLMGTEQHPAIEPTYSDAVTGTQVDEAGAQLENLHDAHFEAVRRQYALADLAYRIAEAADPAEGTPWPPTRRFRNIVTILDGSPGDGGGVKAAAERAADRDHGLRRVKLRSVRTDAGRVKTLPGFLADFANDELEVSQVLPTTVGDVKIATIKPEPSRSELVSLARDVVALIAVRAQLGTGMETIDV